MPVQTGTDRVTFNVVDKIGGFLFLVIIIFGFCLMFANGIYAGFHDIQTARIRTATVAQLATPGYGRIGYRYRITNVTIEAVGSAKVNQYGVTVNAERYQVKSNTANTSFMAAIPEGSYEPELKPGSYTLTGKWDYSSDGRLLIIESFTSTRNSN